MSVTLVLFLSWIPYIGPMVAGYVGGRRAGSILRGLAVGVVASVIVFLIALLLGMGINKLMEPDYQAFIDLLDGISPYLVTGLEEFRSYLSVNFVTVGPDFDLTVATQTFVSLVAFAIIGGVFADQARKELRIIVSQSMNVNRPRPPRSTVAHLNGHEMGFHTGGDLSKISVDAVCATMPKDVPVSPVDRDVPAVPQLSEPAKVDIEAPESVSPESITIADDTQPDEGVPAETVAQEVPSEPKGEDVKESAGQKVPTQSDMDWL